MPGLPPGWESDYDGTRWFYMYKPTGQVQYHFPSEGDEFPDYVDEASPAPKLAPEERLESQQQVKRHGTSHLGSSTSSSTLPWQQPAAKHQNLGATWTGEMSATARPVSFVWDVEDKEDGPEARDADDGVFRPETLMFLGPGTYTDVSPLADEEEEAAKRVVAGDGAAKCVSPDASTGTTPQVKKSGLETTLEDSANSTADATIQTSTHDEAPPASEPAIETPVIHMIDSRELPTELPGSEPWQDPVGRVAEMATAETATARIETHPEPVEIGGSTEITVVRPAVEPVTQTAIQTAPHPTVMEIPGAAVDNPTKGESGSHGGKAMAAVDDPKSGEQDVAEKFSPGRASTQPQSMADPVQDAGVPTPGSKYQPYKPGQVVVDTRRRQSEDLSTHQGSLQRERSLMMSSVAGGVQKLDPSAVPVALHVSKTQRGSSDGFPASNDALSQQQRVVPNDIPERSSIVPQMEDWIRPHGVDKVPSVLRPARGRATSQSKATEQTTETQQHPPLMRPGAGHARHQSDTLPRKPLGGAISEKVGANSQNPSYLPRLSSRSNNFNPDHADLDEASSPQVATAVPISIADMQRAHSVMTRKAVPFRTVPQTDKPMTPPPQSHTAPLDSRSQGSVAASSAADGSTEVTYIQQRRHSSFVPTDVKPLPVASSNSPLSKPSERPLPGNGMRRAPSGVSSVQTISSDSSFTPSPASITPGSGRQSVISPPATGSPSTGVPFERSASGSYFPHAAGASAGLQRSQSLRQSPSPLGSPGEGNDPLSRVGPLPASGHSLTRIEEHDERASSHDVVSLNSQSPSVSRRHSLASTLNLSPKPTPHQPYERQPGAHLQQPSHQNRHHGVAPTGVQAGAYMNMNMNIQTGPLPAQGQHPMPAPVPMSHYQQQQVPAAQHQDRRSMPPGPRVPPKSAAQQYPSYQAPTGWQSQRNSNPVTYPQAAAPVAVPVAPKEKEKKWAKWFKPAKTSSPGAQAAQSTHMPSPGAQSAPWSAQTMGWPQHQLPSAPQMPAAHQQVTQPPYQGLRQPSQSAPQVHANKPVPLPYSGPPGVAKQGPPHPHYLAGQRPHPNQQYVGQSTGPTLMASQRTQWPQQTPVNNSGGARGPTGRGSG